MCTIRVYAPVSPPLPVLLSLAPSCGVSSGVPLPHSRGGSAQRSGPLRIPALRGLASLIRGTGGRPRQPRAILVPVASIEVGWGGLGRFRRSCRNLGTRHKPRTHLLRPRTQPPEPRTRPPAPRIQPPEPRTRPPQPGTRQHLACPRFRHPSSRFRCLSSRFRCLSSRFRCLSSRFRCLSSRFRCLSSRFGRACPRSRHLSSGLETTDFEGGIAPAGRLLRSDGRTYVVEFGKSPGQLSRRRALRGVQRCLMLGVMGITDVHQLDGVPPAYERTRAPMALSQLD